MAILKINESPHVIDRGTLAHFCVSDQYLISKVLRMKLNHHEFPYIKLACHSTVF